MTVATVFAQFWTFRDSVRDFYAFLGQVLARYDLDSAEYSGFKDPPRIERHLDRE